MRSQHAPYVLLLPSTMVVMRVIGIALQDKTWLTSSLRASRRQRGQERSELRGIRRCEVPFAELPRTELQLLMAMLQCRGYMLAG